MGTYPALFLGARASDVTLWRRIFDDADSTATVLERHGVTKTRDDLQRQPPRRLVRKSFARDEVSGAQIHPIFFRPDCESRAHAHFAKDEGPTTQPGITFLQTRSTDLEILLAAESPLQLFSVHDEDTLAGARLAAESRNSRHG